MTDASITCAAIISALKLVDRVLERADPQDSRELARRNAEALKTPDRRVGAALQPKGRRGGDPQEEQRRQRDQDIRALAALIGGKPTQQAQAIASRLSRYHPLTEEASPERRLMQKITGSGLPVGRHRIRKILADQKTVCLTTDSPEIKPS
jgi:hypothetical protein